MKRLIALVLLPIIAILLSTTYTNFVSAQSPECADRCGYAIVDTSGNVISVVVCDNSCSGQTANHYNPACANGGCSYVIQTPQDSSGNVSGSSGSDVRYDSTSNTFDIPGVGQHQPGNTYPPLVFPTAPPTTTEPPQTTTPDSTLPSEPETTPPSTTSLPEYSSDTLSTYSYRSNYSYKSNVKTKSIFIKRPFFTFLFRIY